MTKPSVQLLRTLLIAVDQEQEYAKRRVTLFNALSLAASEGVPCGFRFDPAEPEWPVCYFELPTGQVSWHMPQHVKPWDGHSTDQKFSRVRSAAVAEGMTV